MHINKITILLSLLLMSGCLERNLEYYEANLDEARVKVEQCETSAIKAFTTQDKERVEAVLTDTECLSAVEAVKAHDQKIAELEREKAQKEHEAQKKAAEKKYHEDYAKYSVSLSDLSYIEIDKLNKECRFSVRDKAKCQAVKELNEKKKNEEINVLKDKYVGGKLEEYRKSSCKGGIEFNHVICNIAKEAENQQQEEMINYYLANRDELKKVFNKCHYDYRSLIKLKKWNEANESTKTYQCTMVGRAASKLNVFTFEQPIG